MRNFPFPTQLPSWFIGHMRKALGVMDAKIGKVDLFVEVRDARVPLSSINPRLIGYGKPPHRAQRLVVYCKRDLGDSRFEEPLRKAFRSLNDDHVMFADTQSDLDVRLVYREIIRLAGSAQIHTSIGDGPIELNVMIAGMPNVGKSSLLNSLRRVGLNKRKAAFTGSHAGVTRKVTGVVKICENPVTFIFDTPGIALEYLGTGDFYAERALKMALCGSFKDQLFDIETLAEYLLWRVNGRFFSGTIETSDLPHGLQKYASLLPADDGDVFFDDLARRIGAVSSGAVPDQPRAMRFFIEAFRAGKFGAWSLDDLTFTGSQYGQLEDGSHVFSNDTGIAPISPKASLLPKTALQSINPGTLTVPQSLGLTQRVELAVTSYVSAEMHRFLHPTIATMSKNRIRTQTKIARVSRQHGRYQSQRLSRRPDFLYSSRDRKTRLRRRNRRK